MKSIFKSKTFWTSFLALASGIAMASQNPAAITVTTLLNDPAVQAQVGMIVTGVTGIVLRYKTAEPVKVL